MRSVLFCVALFMLFPVLSGFANPAQAGTFDVDSVAFKIDFNSTYLLRGMSISDGIVMQEGVTAFMGDFTVTGWANFDTREGGFNEIDLVLEYGRKVGDFTLAGGAASLHYPSDDSRSVEVYAKGTWDSPFEPTVLVLRDIRLVDRWYLEASVSQEFVLTKVIAARADVALGNADYWSGQGFGFIQARASLPISLPFQGKILAITPNLGHSRALDKDTLKDVTFGGVSVGMSF